MDQITTKLLKLQGMNNVTTGSSRSKILIEIAVGPTIAETTTLYYRYFTELFLPKIGSYPTRSKGLEKGKKEGVERRGKTENNFFSSKADCYTSAPPL